MMALLLCGLLLLSPANGAAEPTPSPTDAGELIDAVDLSAWDSFFQSLEGTEGWQRPSTLAQEISDGGADPVRLLEWLKQRCLVGLPTAAALCLVSLITGVLGTLAETLLEGAILPVRRVLTMGLAAFLLVRLLPLIQRGIACLRGILSLADVTVPLMTGALLLLGSPRSASWMGTMGELLIHTCLGWMEGSLVPLALSAGVLKAADCMGDSVLSAISRLLFSLTRWGARVICFGYSVVAALMGAGAANMDSLLLRTGRAAAGSLPLVGSLVSDSLGTAWACLGVVKGALGRAGLLLVTIQAVGPAGSRLLCGFGLRAASSLLLPLEQREMGAMLQALGEMLIVLAALVLAAATMLCVTMAGAAGCLGGGL